MTKHKGAAIQYYLYTFALQMRLTRIVNILYLVQFVKISLLEFTVLQSVFSLTQFVMEIPSGVLGDYFKKKTIIIGGLILTASAQLMICSKLVLNSGNPFYLLVAAFMIEGIGRALLSGADDALFFEIIREEGLASAYDKIRGRNLLTAAIAAGIATGLGAFLYEIKSFIPYLGQIFMTLIALVIILSISQHKKAEPIQRAKTNTLKMHITEVLKVRRYPQIVFMLCLIALISGIINTIFGIMPEHISRLGFSSAENGTVFMLLSFVGGIVAMQAYRFSKCGYRKLAIISSLLMTAGVFLVAMEKSKIGIFAGLSLIYVIIDFLDPIVMKVFNLHVADDIRATFLSLVSFLTSAAAMVLYPVSGAVVQNFGMVALLVIVAVITIPILLASCFFFGRFADKG